MITSSPDLPPTRLPEHDEPIYWFALLERAVHDGDFQTAARAQTELAQLGVDVAYRTGPRRRAVRHA